MKTININELQSKVSQIAKEVERGEEFSVVRYSQPVAVIISSKKWEALHDELNRIRGSCRHCVEEFKKIKKKNS